MLLLTGPAPGDTGVPDDLRELQHGIDFVRLDDGSYYLIWSSAGNPPRATSRNWTHDVFYSQIDPARPIIEPKLLIARSEAQEPASADISDDGRIMVTMEDGWRTDHAVAQRFGVYDTELDPINPYPQMVHDGGHSGHVAAVGEQFVVFFSNEWVDGGGVSGLGSGDDVIAHIYSSGGELNDVVDIAVGPNGRDGWPLAVGSEDRAALLWQRVSKNGRRADLMFAVLDPVSGELVQSPMRVVKGVEFYTYGLEYSSAVDRFVITGTNRKGRGFALLMSTDGRIVDRNRHLPATVRESQPIVHDLRNRALVAQPMSPGGLTVLSVTRANIALRKRISDSYRWQYMGTSGIFTDRNTVYVVALSRRGLVEKTFHLRSKPRHAPH